MAVLIVGAGQSGLSAADSLRRAGYDKPITIIGKEVDFPYQRPPLSKQALTGELSFDRFAIRAPEYFDKHSITLALGTSISQIRRSDKVVVASDGTIHGYDKLLLATGTRPRTLNIAGRYLGNIFDLRTLADLRSILPTFTAGARIAVVGGGFVGLEVAATARKLGLTVTVIEAADRIMGRVFGPFMSQWFTDLHVRHGVTMLTGAKVTAFSGSDVVKAVICDDMEVPADVVVLGIGVVPNQELADAAGLVCNDGIVVDEYCRTSHADILAAGDCTRHHNAFYKRDVRLESIHNANAQARVAAHTIAGVTEAYNEVPWFWSDQYDVRLQTVGLSHDHDAAVVRGNPSDGKFSILYMRDGVVIAADIVNNPLEFMQCRKGIPLRTAVDTDRLRDPFSSLFDLLTGK